MANHINLTSGQMRGGPGAAPMGTKRDGPRSGGAPGLAETGGAAFERLHQQALRRIQGTVDRGAQDGLDDLPPPSAGEEARLRWAAEQLEALLLHELLKSMRSTVAKTGLFDSQATKMFEEMLDEERAAQMAQAGGIGLADLIYEQMSRHLPGKNDGPPSTRLPAKGQETDSAAGN